MSFLVLDEKVRRRLQDFASEEGDSDLIKRTLGIKQCEVGSVARYVTLLLRYADLVVSLTQDDNKPYSTMLLYSSPQFAYGTPSGEDSAVDAKQVRSIRDIDVLVFMMPIDAQRVDPVFVVATVTDMGDNVLLDCTVIGSYVSVLVTKRAVDMLGRVLRRTDAGVKFEARLKNATHGMPSQTISLPVGANFSSTERYDLGNDLDIAKDTMGAILLLLSMTVHGPARPVGSEYAKSIVEVMKEHRVEGIDPESRAWLFDVFDLQINDPLLHIDRAPALDDVEITS